jgi:hypothetical protein
MNAFDVLKAGDAILKVILHNRRLGEYRQS